LGPIILWIFFWDISNLRAQEDKNLKLKLGDSVSIYSEKAYRKNAGKVFEAIGNVVILSGNETLYGERANFNIESGEVLIEGNVRIISKDITIYGSRVDYNIRKKILSMQNVRIITNDFNVVADELLRKSNDLYYAKKAEFTTCKDCTESWTIYGDDIEIEINQYVTMKNALVKIKGIDIFYLPYIAIPIKNKRESGVLFPTFLSRANEGLSYQQPVYWAIAEDKDATITPSFWGRRGYGTDLEYRQVFAEDNWFEYNHRMVNDKIYVPEKINNDDSGTNYFRHLYDLEYHGQHSNDMTTHMRLNGAKDLDMFRDYTDFSDNYLQQSNLGFEGFFEKRSMLYNFGIESQYKRNLLVPDATDFDTAYVQVAPSLYFNTIPINLVQSDTPFLNNISVGFSGDFTRFKQDVESDDAVIRNANRFNLQPYLSWHFLNYGPLSFSTHYTLSYQDYKFEEQNQSEFSKSAGFMRTELSFTMDKIFGLAYEDRVKNIDIKKIEKEQTKEDNDLIGMVPSFDQAIDEKILTVVKNSYRHSQEYKFIHHYIAHGDESGNEQFNNQIQASDGWFDYEDAILENQADVGANATRTIIPRKNTIEFQWNNLLIKKTPKKFNYFQDQRYLRDNFSYQRIGYFDVSQGLVIDENRDVDDRLTRLFLNTGYNARLWSLNLRSYYFHQDDNQITTINLRRRFDPFNILSAYNYNSLTGSNIRTLRLGAQFRPTDIIGFTYLRDQDLDADENIMTIYQMDFMPPNNCWIINLNYRESVVDQRYAFNFVFNFGNDDFKEYKENFYNFQRVRSAR
jgi:LPS-assembly protein